jgi:hypothetical protein
MSMSYYHSYVCVMCACMAEPLCTHSSLPEPLVSVYVVFKTHFNPPNSSVCCIRYDGGVLQFSVLVLGIKMFA